MKILVKALLLTLAQFGGINSYAYASESLEPPVCLGECVGQGNVRDGRECFNNAEVADLPTILPTLEANGTRCTGIEQIIGVKVIDTITTVNSRCKRIDKFYCDTTIQGSYTGYRVDRDPSECFNVQEVSNLKKLARTIKLNGTYCRRRNDSIVGVKLNKIDNCYRAPAVYCSRTHTH